MVHSNSQILSAVIARWAQPLMGQLASDKLAGLIPFLGNLEAKIKSTGWVSANWNIQSELSPLIGSMGEKILIPIIHGFVKDLPEESIPEMAHTFIGKAMEAGKLELLEGTICFDADDLRRMKILLEKNLPYSCAETYEVVE